MAKPQEGETIPRCSVFNGTVDRIPSDYQLWLSIRGQESERYYLRKVASVTDTSWSSPVTIGDKKVGSTYVITPILIPTGESDLIAAFYQDDPELSAEKPPADGLAAGPVSVTRGPDNGSC